MTVLRPDTAGVRRSYVDVTGGQVHLRSAGDDADPHPLVCLHMSPASGLVFERFAGAMGAHRRVLVPDTPGFGMSDPTPEPPAIGDYATVVEQVLDTLGVTGPVDLMGYHTGSLTAVELAARRPDLVRTVVTVSMPVFEPAELERLGAHYVTAGPLFDESGEKLLERWRWFAEFFRIGGDDPRNTVADAGRIFTARLSGGERYWWGHHAAFGFDAAARLADVEAPVHVLNIDDDLTEHSRRSAPFIRTGGVVELPQLTHGFLDTATDDAVAVVQELLRGTP